MIHLTTYTKIHLAIEPADFRQGIDGLAAVCRHRLLAEPCSGILFVFINRSKTIIRTLAYDGTGFWLMTKRLSKGKFKGWPNSSEMMEPIVAKALRQLLIGNYDPLPQKRSL